MDVDIDVVSHAGGVVVVVTCTVEAKTLGGEGLHLSLGSLLRGISACE